MLSEEAAEQEARLPESVITYPVSSLFIVFRVADIW